RSCACSVSRSRVGYAWCDGESLSWSGAALLLVRARALALLPSLVPAPGSLGRGALPSSSLATSLIRSVSARYTTASTSRSSGLRSISRDLRGAHCLCSKTAFSRSLGTGSRLEGAARPQSRAQAQEVYRESIPHDRRGRRMVVSRCVFEQHQQLANER